MELLRGVIGYEFEIGAGTGKYSIALEKEGYKVTAVELEESKSNDRKCHKICETNIGG